LLIYLTTISQLHGRGVKLTTHFHLVPRSRMRGAIHPSQCLIKHGENFTLPYIISLVINQSLHESSRIRSWKV